jgi:hypothetical protein
MRATVILGPEKRLKGIKKSGKAGTSPGDVQHKIKEKLADTRFSLIEGELPENDIMP